MSAKEIITYIVIGITIILLWDLIESISRYFSEAKKTKESEGAKFRTELTTTLGEYQLKTNDISLYVNNSLNLLDICRTLILVEIGKILEPYRRLGEKYEYKNLDTDSKKIAEAVYNSLNKDVLTSPALMLTAEYIMEYISSESVLVLMEESSRHNTELSVL